MINNEKETNSKVPMSLIKTDSPDDFAYEGKFVSKKKDPRKENLGDKAYVTNDNPDDFE